MKILKGAPKMFRHPKGGGGGGGGALKKLLGLERGFQKFTPLKTNT